jgi:branched-chain amino acid transport system permease protein
MRPRILQNSGKSAATGAGLLVAVVFLFSLPTVLRSEYWTHVLILSTIWVIMAVSLRCLARVGQISMGSAGFMLVGAYTSAILVMKAGFNGWLSILLGACLAALIAFGASFPFLRAKGVYFAILTVMLSEVLRNIAFYWSKLTGGYQGIANIPPPEPINLGALGTISFDSKANYFYLMLVIAIVCLFMMYRFERSWLGLMWSSINENDRLAGSCGVDVKRHKQLLIVVTAFFMGIAGGFYAHYMGTITPSGDPGSPFGFTGSLYLIIYMMVGGEGYFGGAIVGAYLLTIVPELGRSLQQYIPLFMGAILLLVVFVFPEGIVGLVARLFNAGRRARTRPNLATSLATSVAAALGQSKKPSDEP